MTEPADQPAHDATPLDAHALGQLLEGIAVPVRVQDRQGNLLARNSAWDRAVADDTSPPTIHWVIHDQAGNPVARASTPISATPHVQADADDIEQTRQALHERVKELRCLYRIAEAVESCADALETLWADVVDLLPDAMQHPEYAWAHIHFQGTDFHSQNYQPGTLDLRRPLMLRDQQAGYIEIGYAPALPQASPAETTFIPEERDLLDAVAERLTRVAERIRTREQLLAERSALQQKNIALRELMDNIQHDKAEVGRRVLTNVRKVIGPLLDSHERTLGPEGRRYVDLIRENLEDITSPFADQISRRFERLTPLEIRICEHIRRGLSSKQIASLEGMAPATMRSHRHRIRGKLGLLNKKANLQTFLNAQAQDDCR